MKNTDLLDAMEGVRAEQVWEAGELLGVPLIDHLILGKPAAGDGGPPAFRSLAEAGVLG